MSHSSNKRSSAIQNIKEIVKKIFPQNPTGVERVKEGASTYVYRILFPHETFYLRILPEESASFSPEVAVHNQLRQMQVNVPEVIYFEHCNELLQRSVMVTTEIIGKPISQSSDLSQFAMEVVLRAAGRDLACLNNVLVEGFGWVKRDSPEGNLRAEWPTYRAFALEYWESDMMYLAQHVLQHSKVVLLEKVRSNYDSWLDCKQSYLAHGDLDTTHVYQENGRYTGIIDFGEIRGADRWYDLGHFHMRDGEFLPFRLLSALVSGYGEMVSLPLDYERHLHFASLLINVRVLVRSLQKRPPNRFTQHQLDVLRADVVALLAD